MATAVIVITLLTLAASLASWLFSQWLARKARVSPGALALGGGGAVLLIASVAFVMAAASTGWRQLMPVQAGYSRDDDMLSMLVPAAIVAEWQATDCVTSTRMADSARWMLDNDCGRVVAVLFASCSPREASCSTNALLSQGWSYQPTGILMTAANDRPVPLRLGDGGPLVAPIFTIRDAGQEPRQIRYLACDVTAPGVLQVLREPGGESSQERLAAELRADACYAQVLAWSGSGQRRGASPDALLRDGID